jgi:ArsR family transcriptional regulator
MPAKPHVEDQHLIRVLKALAHPIRFRMVQEIAAAGELSCGGLGEKFDVSQPTVSHHLKILGDSGLLKMRNHGQHHFVSIDQRLLAEVAGMLPTRLARPPARRKAGRKP